MLAIASIVFALAPFPVAQKAPQTPAAQEKPAAGSRADAVAALRKQYDDAQSEYYTAMRAAKTPEEREKLKGPDAGEWAPKFWDIWREDPKDAAALDALSWIVEESPTPKDRDDALAAVEKDHLKSPGLAPLCVRLGNTLQIGTKLLERIFAENPDATVRGTALYQIANHRLESVRTAKEIAGLDEAKRGPVHGWLGEERYQELLKLDAAKTEAEALGMLDRVVKEFADVPTQRGSTLGETARADLHEIRDLVVGKPVPDIEGEDLAGVKFKLSDYRGKVVLLDFWGNW
ncbi:MAG TPA: hypothetical protein VGR31_03560 [Planctomycetota bacterium]|jgi:hypothetical protein|nr:hypothetical protein [Planctomycetota bacterium]